MSLASFVMGGFVGIVVPASTLASRFVQMKAKDMPMVVMGQYGSRQHHHADHQQHPGYESSLLHGVQKYGKDCLYTNNSPQSTRSITEFSSVTIAVNMKELRETLCHSVVNLPFRILYYQIEARFSGAMYNGSVSVMPKASYHALMCGRAPFTRQRPSECGSLLVYTRICSSRMLPAHTPA